MRSHLSDVIAKGANDVITKGANPRSDQIGGEEEGLRACTLLCSMAAPTAGPTEAAENGGGSPGYQAASVPEAEVGPHSRREVGSSAPADFEASIVVLDVGSGDSDQAPGDGSVLCDRCGRTISTRLPDGSDGFDATATAPLDVDTSLCRRVLRASFDEWVPIGCWSHRRAFAHDSNEWPCCGGGVKSPGCRRYPTHGIPGTVRFERNRVLVLDPALGRARPGVIVRRPGGDTELHALPRVPGGTDQPAVFVFAPATHGSPSKYFRTSAHSLDAMQSVRVSSLAAIHFGQGVAPVLAVVRWFGKLNGFAAGRTIVGLEALSPQSIPAQMLPLFHDGSYRGKRLFACAHRAGYFAELGDTVVNQMRGMDVQDGTWVEDHRRFEANVDGAKHACLLATGALGIRIAPSGTPDHERGVPAGAAKLESTPAEADQQRRGDAGVQTGERPAANERSRLLGDLNMCPRCKHSSRAITTGGIPLRQCENRGCRHRFSPGAAHRTASSNQPARLCLCVAVFLVVGVISGGSVGVVVF
jgi:hypothetical protein